jgi:hypothetical protein
MLGCMLSNNKNKLLCVKLFLRGEKICPIIANEPSEITTYITLELFKNPSNERILDYLDKTGQIKVLLREKRIRLEV